MSSTDPTLNSWSLTLWKSRHTGKPESRQASVLVHFHVEVICNPHDVNRHDDRIRAFCLTFDKPFAWATVAGALDALVTYRGPDLLRVKGILNVAESDKPVVIHGVQHVFHPPAVLEKWPDEDRRSKIVFITRDIPEATIRRVLKSFIDGADQWTST